ncbi:MAG: galactose oxidase early set domain-containing protein [Telluria sp.]
MTPFPRVRPPLLALALMLPVLAPGPAQAHPGASASAKRLPPSACKDAAIEGKLKERELALLGRTHAEEHAESRQHRCRVLQGLETEEARPTAQALAAAAALAPEQAGAWSEPFVIPVAGVTAVLLHTAKVLFWSYDPAHYDDPTVSNIGVSYLWNPTTRTGEFIPAPENIWCAGQTILADGRVFIAGGNLRFPDPTAPAGQRGWKGDASTYIYNPASGSYIKQPEMASGRWYPTVTQLPDNSAIITSGYDETGSQRVTQLVERFVPSAARNGVGTISTVSVKRTPGLYPFQYVLPSGSMLQAGPELLNSYLLDPSSWSWTRLPNMLYDHGGGANGIHYTDASVEPHRQIVTIAGGKVAPSNNEWLDGYDPVAGWRDYPKWNLQRHNSNTVILPDGSLLTVGGNAAKTNYGGTLFSAELYSKPADDLSGTWTTVAPHSIPAAYHSSALLLPNGTVLLSEDDRTKTAEAAASHRVQVYSPPYLFKGARPKMGAPSTLVRGSAFAITATPAPERTIASAVLIAPAAVTHGNDMHQRFIKLPLVVDGTGIVATVPASTALVPPGYYMLFIVDSEGVPSIAKFVHIA